MNRGTSTESMKSRLSGRVSEWVGKFWLSRGTWGVLEEVLSRKVVFFSIQNISTTYCAERILISFFPFPYFAAIFFTKTIFYSRDCSDIKILDWVDLNRLSRFESTQSVFHRLSRFSTDSVGWPRLSRGPRFIRTYNRWVGASLKWSGSLHSAQNPLYWWLNI